MIVRCWLKIPSRGYCSASQGLPSDAEQLSRVTEFSIPTEQPWWILFLAYSSFALTFVLENVLFYQIYAQITTFFCQEMFGSVPIYLRRWHGNLWQKMTLAWCQGVKNDDKTKSSFWRHALESSYTPHVIRHFLAPVGLTEIPVGYARNVDLIRVYTVCHSWIHNCQSK